MLRRRVLLLVLSVLAGLSLAPIHAQDAPPLQPDLARIVERGTLVVAQVNEDVPLVFAKKDDGELTGFDIDLARALAENLGVALQVQRTAETYDDVIRQLAAGEADLGISFLSRTARRAKVVLFSRPYIEQTMTLLINRVKGLRFRDKCPSVEELIGKTEFADLLGVENDTSYEARVRGLNPDAKLQEFDTIYEAHEALLSGDVAITLQGELSARRFLSENPAARIRLQYCAIGRVTDQIAIAVAPGRYGLLNWVNVFLDEHGIDYRVSDLISHEGPWSF